MPARGTRTPNFKEAPARTPNSNRNAKTEAHETKRIVPSKCHCQHQGHRHTSTERSDGTQKGEVARETDVEFMKILPFDCVLSNVRDMDTQGQQGCSEDQYKKGTRSAGGTRCQRQNLQHTSPEIIWPTPKKQAGKRLPTIAQHIRRCRLHLVAMSLKTPSHEEARELSKTGY